MRSLLIQFVWGLAFVFHTNAQATWSVLAVDTQSGEMVVSSATCLQQKVFATLGAKDLRDIQAVVVLGKGIAVAQSFVDTTRQNQQLIRDALTKNIAPSQILELLKNDKNFETRQFGILNLQGERASFNGSKNLPTALSQGGSVGSSIHYQLQGNVLASQDVIFAAAQAFEQAKGKLSDRVMAAMEAADSKGGDMRCFGQRTAFVSYLLAIDKYGKETYISVTDNDVSNPIVGLRKAYGASTLGSSVTKALSSK